MIDYTLPLEELPDPLPIVPLEKPFDVTITPPGSKSITNRAYVLAALAEGESRIVRPLRAEDTDLLLEALCKLGAEARWEGEDVLIRGVGGRFPRGGSVYLGDGGTPTRFMIAAACLAAEPVIVDGSKRMRERPIAEGVEMLRQLGARIEYVEEEGRLPVRVVPSETFKGGELRVGKTASSQFISAVMLIAPWLRVGVQIQFDEVTSAAYVLLTRDVLGQFGLPVRRNLLGCFAETRLRELRIRESSVKAARFPIESDASSALYWVLACAISGDSCIGIEGIDTRSHQPDASAICEFEALGVTVDFFGREDHDMPNDHLAIRSQNHRPLAALEVNCEQFPDGSIALAAVASTCGGTSRLTGLHTLRVKETDRLAALANELRKVGCEVQTTEDSITITPPRDPDSHGQNARATDPVTIETYNDHRMAMSFAVLGLVRPGISIRNPKCVAKSYPTFWKDFAKLYG